MSEHGPKIETFHPKFTPSNILKITDHGKLNMEKPIP